MTALAAQKFGKRFVAVRVISDSERVPDAVAAVARSNAFWSSLSESNEREKGNVEVQMYLSFREYYMVHAASVLLDLMSNW